MIGALPAAEHRPRRLCRFLRRRRSLREVDYYVVITAKKAGSTNLIILDDANNEIFEAAINVGGQNLEKVQNARGRVHGYYAYSCPRGEDRLCERLDDKLESEQRIREQSELTSTTTSTVEGPEGVTRGRTPTEPPQ